MLPRPIVIVPPLTYLSEPHPDVQSPGVCVGLSHLQKRGAAAGRSPKLKGLFDEKPAEPPSTVLRMNGDVLHVELIEDHRLYAIAGDEIRAPGLEDTGWATTG